MKITKRFGFSASHRLFNPAFSEARNREAFGECNRPHGHNFTLDVTIEGDTDPATGMVINFHTLKRIVDENVVRAFDHKDFGSDVPEFSGKVQTVENLAVIIWQRLCGKMPAGVRLSNVRVAETEGNWAEYGG